MKNLAPRAIALALVSLLGAAAVADEYYVQFYSYENAWNGPGQSHTFARFLRAVDGEVKETVDISWLPAPGQFAGIGGRRVPLLRRVDGYNYTVEQTIGIANRFGLRVIPDGPYPATARLFEGAKRQRNTLRSGAIDYSMLNGGGRGSAINCIRAVSRAAGVDIGTGTNRGSGATSLLRDEFIRRGLVTSPMPVAIERVGGAEGGFPPRARSASSGTASSRADALSRIVITH